MTKALRSASSTNSEKRGSDAQIATTTPGMKFRESFSAHFVYGRNSSNFLHEFPTMSTRCETNALLLRRLPHRIFVSTLFSTLVCVLITRTSEGCVCRLTSQRRQASKQASSQQTALLDRYESERARFIRRPGGLAFDFNRGLFFLREIKSLYLSERSQQRLQGQRERERRSAAA